MLIGLCKIFDKTKSEESCVSYQDMLISLNEIRQQTIRFEDFERKLKLMVD